MPFAHPLPYDGIPQEPSEQSLHESELPETFALKDEMSFICFVELQFGQVISSCFSPDLYSKTGILFFFIFSCY